MVAASLLSSFFLALAVAANPVERSASLTRLPFARRVNDGVFNVLKLDQLRANFLSGFGIKEFSSPATNIGFRYVASVGVGDPPTYYDLSIDSGSANTWVGARKPYVKTSTSHKTSNDVSVTYGSGGFNGTEYIDQITIAPGLVIRKQSIGAANESSGHDDVDGILGIGPAALTEGTLTPAVNTSIPTVTDNLVAEGTITCGVLGISFKPHTDPSGSETNGELTWGGIDPTKFVGELTYMPITSTPPASAFWGMEVSMNYGGDTPILIFTSGMLDTGTLLILIATDAFEAYKAATGAVLDNTTTLLQVTPAQFAKLKSLFINVNGASFELTPDAQLWPRKLNHLVNGTADGLYLVIGDIGIPSGSGYGFILGDTFLQRFYAVLDSSKHRVGLGYTTSTFAEVNYK